MIIHDSLDSEYDPSGGCVLAVGNFDGVHRGHQLIFKTAVKLARERQLQAVLLTFSRHPASIVRPGEIPEPLMAMPDRLEIAREFGFREAFVLDFDSRMAAMLPAGFVEEVLETRLGARAIVAGEDWRFGRNRKGDMTLLESMGPARGFEVHAVPPFMVDDLPVSSTRIRGALAAGDATEAARLLGRPHFVRGTVVSGEGRGRKIGFPTVNIDSQGVLVPAEGVYAGGYQTTECSRKDHGESGGMTGSRTGTRGPAAISIGTSPTFGEGPVAVEAHLIGRQGDLYGEIVTLVFLERLREQKTFPSAAELADQISLDVQRSREIYSTSKLENIPC